ncbi:MAG: hypothetical protein HZA11_07285 [Nitrospirae bacterium]|nr:hypothetical protein [Nitrospirota bacterium]
MPAVKIKNIHIQGLRGVKDELVLPLEEKSIVLYGDNGTGKSSITDSIEWFYYGKIAHLSGEEIGKLGLEALRNISLPDDKKGSLEIKYSNSSLNCSKNIEIKKGILKTDSTNKNTSFVEFIKASQRERLILHYAELVNFILSTKTEKLANVSEIIGFSEVTSTRTVLKKALNDLARELKNKNLDGTINIQQGNLLKQLNQNITSEPHFINAINELISPLKLGKKIEKFSDINAIIMAIKKPTDNTIIEQQSFYSGIRDHVGKLKLKIDSFDEAYREYETQYNKLSGDADNLKKIILNDLLGAGEKILKEGHYTDSSCPLCLQPKDSKYLLKEIQERIDDIKKVRAEQKKLSDIKTQFEATIKEVAYDVNGLLKNKYFIDPSNAKLKAKVEIVKNALSKYSQELIVDIAADKKIKTSAELKIKPNSLNEVEAICSQKYDQLKSQIKDDKATDIVVKIELSKSAYSQIEALKKEKELIEEQKATFEIIYADFVKKQKEGLESFINNFSGIINEYYQFMNPEEQIKEIKLKTIENEDELVGLTVSFKYYDSEVSPPHKYFSESHLNCFGLAFFLASVRAFNKENKFILMDDVISSFDANHRKRFADLLIEKFAEYQIILLTHEKQWFDYVKSVVQNKNWQISEIKWSEAKGAHLEESAGSLRQRIEYKITNNVDDDLGNNIRVYLEHILKNIASTLKVKVEFQFNDKNEDRMCHELLSELKGKAAKSSTDFTVYSPLFGRTLASTFIANKDSHDSSFNPSMGDLKALWKDAQDIENLFYCVTCQKFVSLKYYDEGNKKVKCKCGAKEYSWKK